MALRICGAAGKVAFVRHQDAEKVIASYRKRAQGGGGSPALRLSLRLVPPLARHRADPAGNRRLEARPGQAAEEAQTTTEEEADMKRIVIKAGQVWVTRRGKTTRTPFRSIKAVLQAGSDQVQVAYSSGGSADWLHVCDRASFIRWIGRHNAKPTRTRRPRTLVLR